MGIESSSRPCSILIASRSDQDSRRYYDRKRAEGKKHNAALICRARRGGDLIDALLHVLRPCRHRPPTAAVAA